MPIPLAIGIHRNGMPLQIHLEGDEVLFEIQASGDVRPELEGLQEKGQLLFCLLDRPVRTIVQEA